MTTRLRHNSKLAYAMWGIGGVSVGACVATVVDGRWSPEWVGATGTWFGGIATVLALLWAVRSFRSDQADRADARAEVRAQELVAEMKRELRASANAKNVSISLQGGAGFGGGPWKMTSVHVIVQNDSDHDVLVTDWHVDDALQPNTQRPRRLRVPSGTMHRETYDIQELPADKTELSGGRLTRFLASMDYSMEGIDWHRSSTGMPERR